MSLWRLLRLLRWCPVAESVCAKLKRAREILRDRRKTHHDIAVASDLITEALAELAEVELWEPVLDAETHRKIMRGHEAMRHLRRERRTDHYFEYRCGGVHMRHENITESRHKDPADAILGSKESGNG